MDFSQSHNLLGPDPEQHDVEAMDINIMGKRKNISGDLNDGGLEVLAGRKKSKIVCDADHIMVQVAEVGVVQPREEQ